MARILGETSVYREDWEFRMDDVEDYFASSSGFIKNNDVYGLETYDFMEYDDFELCKELDDAIYSLTYELKELLEDRVYFEYDVNNDVIYNMVEIIKKDWGERDDWTDAIDIINAINEGCYDDDMKYYYTYLQASSLLENLYLIEFNTDDLDDLEESLKVNNITIDDDEVEFRYGYTIETVDRTVDLEADVKDLLQKVIDELKNKSYYTNIKKYFY